MSSLLSPNTDGGTQKWTLEKEMELRFEILVSGTAECVGTELAPGVRYTFKEIEGDCHAYSASETPMNFYANVHGYLQQERFKAHANSTQGPRVMVVGSTDSGKKALCRLLCSYAARMEETPTYVDLDIGQGSITISGNLAAVPVERPVDIEDGFGGAPSIVYFYGNTSTSHNPKLYTQQVGHLANAVAERAASNPYVAASGTIINTSGMVEGTGYQLLLEAINSFNPHLILVIAHERLFSDLTMALKGREDITLVKTPKSGGVVVREQQKRERYRMARTHEYFYGPKGDLSPHSTSVSFRSELKYSGRQAPSSALPIGAQSTIDPLEPREVAPSLELRHSVLGVAHVTDVGDGLLKANLQGFIYISEVDLDQQRFTALTPCPGHLPGKFLLLGNLKYMES